MYQLGELGRRYESFAERQTRVLAVDQEDASLDGLLQLTERIGELPFDVTTDLDRRATARYERVTTYLLDRNGVVLEIFPSHPGVWMPWDAVLQRIDDHLAATR